MSSRVVPRLRGFGFDVSYSEGYACQVLLGRDASDTEWRLSVSYPPDAHGFLETALFHGASLVYVDEVGYDDVCRFDEVSEVVEEVRRLQDEFAAGKLVEDADGDDPLLED